jgi:serine/threonine-protein kinase
MSQMQKLEKLGKYEIGRELGRGAMGVVYEGFDPQIERAVAIKTILKSSVEKHELAETFSRFRREARAAGRLTHPKIVSIYEYGEDDDMAFIVMELIHGKELKDFFDQQNRFPIHDGIRIVMQILDALDYSHSRGVVHRDIKPANILITDGGKIKVADFGIAKVDSSHMTQVGMVLGTPTYMSPEQFMGLEVDHRTDIYATGVILYQFLTGERPFTGSVISIMHQAVNQEAKPPSQLNPEISFQLDEVVKKAMAKKPEHRFQSATEFMQALKKAVQLSQPANSTPAPASGRTSSSPLVAEVTHNTLTLPVKDLDKPDPRTEDIKAWKAITDSSQVIDFINYLKKWPEGEFSELARQRISVLQKIIDQEQAAAAELQRLQQAQQRTIQETKARELAAQEKLAAQRQMQKAAELRQQQEEQEKARLRRQLEVLKIEAAKARAEEEAKQAKEASAQALRAQTLASSLGERGQQLAEVVSGRASELALRQSLKQDVKRELEAEIEAKKQAKAARLRQKENDELNQDAKNEPINPAQLHDNATHLQALAEAEARAESAERLHQLAEQKSALEKKRTQHILIVSAGLVLLLGVLWLANG